MNLLDGEIIAVMFVAGFASGLAGFAFALIASGLLFIVLPPLTAVPLILASSLFAQLFTVVAVRKHIVWPRLWPFLLGGVAGVPLGTALLRVAAPATFRLWLGCFLIAYSLVMLARRGMVTVIRAGAGTDGLIGLCGGLLGGLAGVSGAVPTAWCGLRGWTPDEQRAVYQPYIVVVQIASLISLGASLPIPPGVVRLFLESAPAVMIGIFLGLRLYRRVDDRAFRRIILGLLFVSGAALVV